MKLLTKCIGCKEDIRIKSSARTRPDLEYELGEEISVSCPHCHRKQKKHPNEVRAVENYLVSFVALIIGLFLSLILWTLLGPLAAVTISAPMYLYVAESKNVLTFNKYRL